MKIQTENFKIDATGNLCKGDHIIFEEAVFGGSWRRPKFQGKRVVEAKIVSCSYGEKTGMHNFTLEYLKAEGHLDDLCGYIDRKHIVSKFVDSAKHNFSYSKRKRAKNVYNSDICKRVEWKDESERELVLKGKYREGRIAKETKRQNLQNRGW